MHQVRAPASAPIERSDLVAGYEHLRGPSAWRREPKGVRLLDQFDHPQVVPVGAAEKMDGQPCAHVRFVYSDFVELAGRDDPRHRIGPAREDLAHLVACHADQAARFGRLFGGIGRQGRGFSLGDPFATGSRQPRRSSCSLISFMPGEIS